MLSVTYYVLHTSQHVCNTPCNSTSVICCVKVFIHAEHRSNINLVTTERQWEQAQLCVFASICISAELFEKRCLKTLTQCLIRLCFRHTFMKGRICVIACLKNILEKIAIWGVAHLMSCLCSRYTVHIIRIHTYVLTYIFPLVPSQFPSFYVIVKKQNTSMNILLSVTECSLLFLQSVLKRNCYWNVFHLQLAVLALMLATY